MKIAKVLAGAVTVLVVIGVFWLVGRWDWGRGWALIGLLITSRIISVPYLWRKNPELMKRRGQFGEGTKTWDIAVLVPFGLTFLAIPIVAALDIRYGWSAMPLWLWPVGAVLYAGFVGMITWSMAVNPFFLRKRSGYNAIATIKSLSLAPMVSSAILGIPPHYLD